MTRELKLALILGSSLVLVVGVLISDHLSGARDARIARVDPPLVAAPVEQMPPLTAGRPRTQPNVESALVQNVTPQDASFNSPQLALGDPVPQVAPQNADEQFVADAKPFGVEFKPMDDLAATRIDPVNSPFEIIMGQPVAPSDQAKGGTASSTSAPAGAATSEYTIKQGDTLWTLATRFMGNGSRHPELAEMNKGRLGPGGELRVGTKILVPGAVADAGRTPTTQPQSAPKKAAAPKTYTVKSGDTLWKIAAKTLGSESRWKDLMDANKSVIKDPNALRTGAVLKIPSR